MKNRTKVLIVIGTYLPGSKGGGHIRSISSLVEALGDIFDFYIICLDRDTGATDQYPNIEIGVWNKIGKGRVMYLKPPGFTFTLYRSIFSEIKPDVLYLNTVFSFSEVVLPILLVLVFRYMINIIIAPRGCLNPGALKLKKLKKTIFLLFFKLSTIPRRVIWHASTELENDFIHAILPHSNVVIAPNLSAKHTNLDLPNLKKQNGEVNFLYLSRIVPVKNLLFFLNCLKNHSGLIHLTIAGPLEDTKYWEQCLEAMKVLTNVTIKYIGTITHDDVIATMKSNHFFVLPTLGENYGHAIDEALQAGIPILISDCTPWNDISRLGAGWTIPLNSPERWSNIITGCIDMDGSTYNKMSEACKLATASIWNESARIDANIKLLNSQFATSRNRFHRR